MSSVDRDRYARMYGPTLGDRVRLADTDLWLEVEEDRCAGGDEAVFGGGKGAGIGALAGAGGGALTQLFTRGKQISVPAETAMTFRLERTLVLHP